MTTAERTDTSIPFRKMLANLGIRVAEITHDSHPEECIVLSLFDTSQCHLN